MKLANEVEQDTPYLFVFGTLMRKHGHPAGLRLNSEAIYIDEATIKAEEFEWTGGFPTLVGPGSGDVDVHGEVYQITDPFTWQWMDRYEGRPTLFDRKTIPIRVGDVTLKCWVYEYQT